MILGLYAYLVLLLGLGLFAGTVRACIWLQDNRPVMDCVTGCLVIGAMWAMLIGYIMC